MIKVILAVINRIQLRRTYLEQMKNQVEMEKLCCLKGYSSLV